MKRWSNAVSHNSKCARHSKRCVQIVRPAEAARGARSAAARQSEAANDSAPAAGIALTVAGAGNVRPRFRPLERSRPPRRNSMLAATAVAQRGAGLR
jgi:hypothetical protein